MTKHLIDRPPVLLPVLVTVLLAGVVAGGLHAAPIVEAAPASANATTVAIAPPEVTLACGETKQVDVRVNDVENLFGVDVKVTYDTSKVEVVDANATMPGIQIQQGNMPDVGNSNGLIQINSVDVGTGTISYAAIRLNPAQPQSGSGVVASITFRAKAAGTSAVNFASVVLSDQTARPIAAELVNGQIKSTCTNPPPTGVPPTGVPPTTVPGRPTATTVPGRPTATAIPPVPGTKCSHVVRPNDTLYSIARMYGTSVEAIMAGNTISDPNLIYVGQALTIPGCTKPTPGQTPPPGHGCTAYVVKPFDTLFSIALATGDNVPAICQRNGIANPNLIFVGQPLQVCPAGRPGPGHDGPRVCRSTHVVAPGETLYRIALAAGTTVARICAANGIANPNLVYAGQTICIP